MLNAHEMKSSTISIDISILCFYLVKENRFCTYILLYCRKQQLKSYFPSWEVIIVNTEEVVKFTCGLMPDPRPLVYHVYTMFIEHECGSK